VSFHKSLQLSRESNTALTLISFIKYLLNKLLALLNSNPLSVRHADAKVNYNPNPIQMRIRDTDSKMSRKLNLFHIKVLIPGHFHLGMVSACSSLQQVGKTENRTVCTVPAERAAVELHGAGDEDEAGAQLLQHYHTLTLRLYTMIKQKLPRLLRRPTKSTGGTWWLSHDASNDDGD
jgi:hypothetical protein